MHRLPLALAAILAALALLVPAALGARVSVRVEGKTTTIYGASEPRFEAGANALEALEGASARGEFFYEIKQLSFGPYVSRIGRYPADASSGWVFKVNGASPPVGADKVTLNDGDRVLWYWATFGDAGGPKTLLLQRRPKGCYRVLAQDDAGKSTPAQGAVLLVDGRRREDAGRCRLSGRAQEPRAGHARRRSPLQRSQLSGTCSGSSSRSSSRSHSSAAARSGRAPGPPRSGSPETAERP